MTDREYWACYNPKNWDKDTWIGGAEYTTPQTVEKAELKEALNAWKDDIIDEIHTIVNDVLGSRWEAYNIASYGFEVCLLDSDGNPIFGHSFPVRFGYDIRETEAG